MATKTITKEELDILRKGLREYNEVKIKLGETIIQQQTLMGAVARLRAQFSQEEQKLIDKYGKHTRINMETGEIAEIKEK